MEEALKSLTIDIVEVLQRQNGILKQVEQLSPEDDVTKFEQAIETILEYVDQIDTAHGEQIFFYHVNYVLFFL